MTPLQAQTGAEHQPVGVLDAADGRLREAAPLQADQVDADGLGPVPLGDGVGRDILGNHRPAAVRPVGDEVRRVEVLEHNPSWRSQAALADGSYVTGPGMDGTLAFSGILDVITALAAG